MRRTTALATTALLALAPLVAACDSKGDGGNDQEAARAAAEKAIHAVGNRDIKGYCEMGTTHDGTKPLKEDEKQMKECQEGMASLAAAPDSELKGFKEAKVKKATVNGDRATVERADVEGLAAPSGKDAGGSEGDNLRLRKIKDAWYIDGSPRTGSTAAPAGKS